MSFPLETCWKVCKDLGFVVTPSFGPRGQLALIADSVGQVTLSSSGVVILDAAANNLHSPIANTINEAVVRHHGATGDGSKTFVLLLMSLTESIFKALPRSGDCNTERQMRVVILKEIHQMTETVLPEAFRKLHNSATCIAHGTETFSSIEQLKTLINGLATTFFTGKFGVLVSRSLSELMCDFICNSVSNVKSFSQTLRWLVENFETLSTRCGKLGIGDSRILPGLVISRDFRVYNDTLEGATEVNFIIISSPGENTTKSADLLLENESDVEKTAHWDGNAASIVRHWNNQRIGLVICESTIPIHLGLQCRLYKIAVVVMIDSKESQILQKAAAVRPMDYYASLVEETNIGRLKSVEPICVGKERLVHLQFASSALAMFPQHLVLCGPTDPLCKQYFSECLNCLKICSVGTSFTEENLVTISDKILVCPAGGCWESELAKVLKTIKKPTEYFSEMMIKALLSVPRALQGYNKKALLNELKMMKSPEPLCVDYEDLSIVPSKDSRFFESVSAKEQLVYSVCQILVQILRVEGMVSVVKKAKAV